MMSTVFTLSAHADVSFVVPLADRRTDRIRPSPNKPFSYTLPPALCRSSEGESNSRRAEFAPCPATSPANPLLRQAQDRRIGQTRWFAGLSAHPAAPAALPSPPSHPIPPIRCSASPLFSTSRRAAIRSHRSGSGHSLPRLPRAGS